MRPDAPIGQAKANSDKHAECICDPATSLCAAVEGGLYKLNNDAKGAGTYEYGEYQTVPCGTVGRQPDVPACRSPQAQGVAPQAARASLWLKRGSRTRWRDVEIFAHTKRLFVLDAGRKLTHQNWIFPPNWKLLSEQRLRASDMQKISIIKIIKNLLYTYINNN